MLRVVGVDILGLSSWHRRRIKTEEKAKVVADVQGTELIQFLAALAIFHQDDLKKRMNRIIATCRNGFFRKWMIIMFTQYQTTTLPKWMFSHKLLFKSSLLLNSQCVPQKTAATFAFSSIVRSFVPGLQTNFEHCNPISSQKQKM